jgi:excisionase family DNA binding protein
LYGIETMSQDLLTVNETAGMLRLQASTIRAWILNRRIPFVRLGRRVFVRRSDCEQLITANVVPAANQGAEHGRASI